MIRSSKEYLQHYRFEATICKLAFAPLPRYISNLGNLERHQARVIEAHGLAVRAEMRPLKLSGGH